VNNTKLRSNFVVGAQSVKHSKKEYQIAPDKNKNEPVINNKINHGKEKNNEYSK